MVSRVRPAALMIMLGEPQPTHNWSTRVLPLSKMAALVGVDIVGIMRGASAALGRR